jgi:putative ABC transport system ATP-binding protein
VLREAFTFVDVVLERDGRRLLDGVSDHIHAGATTALVGDSGSGKSTFLRLLNRFEEPTSGSIVFDERPLAEHDVHTLRRRVSLVAQRPTMLTTSVGDELCVGRSDLETARIDQLLEQVALAHIAHDRDPRSMSGGEQQRLALARALAVDPDVLLLDEPTSALDERASAAVDDVIRHLITSDLTVVLVSHDLDRVVGVADHVLVLERGRLVERGTPGDVSYLA